MGALCSCCCGTRDVVPDAPDVIIPDPEEDEQIVVTIDQAAIASRDYLAYRGLGTEDRNERWFFLNKSGSKWGGNVQMEVENFVRGLDPNDENKGQVLWRSDFIDQPFFQQQLRDVGGSMLQFAFTGFIDSMFDRPHYDDGYYISHGGGWDRDYRTSLFLNWNMRTEASLSSTVRKGFGFPVKLVVYAQGTGVARYFEVEEPIYEERGEGENRQRVQVGTRRRWERHEREFVDFVQFAVCDLASGQPVVDQFGAAVVFTVHGDSTDWTNNYATKFFDVQQRGGWFTKDPPTITTKAGVDPALALLIAHLCTKEFSTAQIKSNFHPRFPYDPLSAVFGFF